MHRRFHTSQLLVASPNLSGVFLNPYNDSTPSPKMPTSVSDKIASKMTLKPASAARISIYEKTSKAETADKV